MEGGQGTRGQECLIEAVKVLGSSEETHAL